MENLNLKTAQDFALFKGISFSVNFISYFMNYQKFGDLKQYQFTISQFLQFASGHGHGLCLGSYSAEIRVIQGCDFI